MHICEYGCGREAKFPPVKGRTKWCCEANWSKCPEVVKKRRKSFIEIPINTNQLCSFGCGKKAKFLIGKNATILCCSRSINSCPAKKSRVSKSLKGRTYIDLHGEEKAKQLKETMSSRPITPCSEETRKKLSKLGRRPCSEETKRKISKSLRHKTPLKETIEKMRKTKIYSLKILKKKYPLFSKIEELKENSKTKNIFGRCKNHKCEHSKEKGGWFLLNRRQLFDRIKAIESGMDGCYFYCSEECKQECILFNRSAIQLINFQNKEIYYTQEEYNTWRDTVLNRENHICEYCNERATHAHHIRTQKLEPFFSLDLDFGVACCRSCHYQYGHPTGTDCSTGSLAHEVCI